MVLPFDVRLNPNPRAEADRLAILRDPGFGRYCTDHMAVATWTDSDGWSDSAIMPYGPFALDPSAAVLHYAQEVFEGLKAYRHADNSVWLFRAEINAARMARSAERLALPALPTEDFLASIEALVRTDIAWLPTEPDQSLYLRPFMFASEAFLGVRAARRVTYCVIASPAASYFAGGFGAVKIWISDELTRAAPGGTGAAKCGGNYASSLLAQQLAESKGYSQVLFLDGRERRWVEELGGMNLFLITSDNELVTPPLNGSILEGVSRQSIMALAPAHGLRPVEREVAIDDLLADIETGKVTEVFACGTAAVVSPIGAFGHRRGDITVADGQPGKQSVALRQNLLDIQYGKSPDLHGWLRKID